MNHVPIQIADIFVWYLEINLFYESFSDDKAYSNTFLEGACNRTLFRRLPHQTIMCTVLPTANQMMEKNKNLNGL